MVQLLGKIAWWLLKKLNRELPYGPAILLPIAQRIENRDSKQVTSTSLLTAALFTVAKRWAQPKYPTLEEWTHRMWCAHTQRSSLQPSMGRRL